MPLLRNFWKIPQPYPPGYMEPTSDPPKAVVSGSASVPVTLHMEGFPGEGAVGVDLIFLIDDSGSLANSDPDRDRFSAIRTLSAEFTPSRDGLDRIAVILFGGDKAVLAEPLDPWKHWSELPGLIDTLGSPGGATPFEKGMRLATDKLAALNSNYRLVVLLSDGDPVPDDENYNQTNIIITERVPEAFENRVLYSTVYLSAPGMPRDNALMQWIARHTDYITHYCSESEPAKYYFRIQDTNQLVAAFSRLFRDIENRAVPLDVNLVEQISPRLLLDPQHPPEFHGNGINPAQNVIRTPLDQALTQFAQQNHEHRHRFEIRLNELNGEATLSFHVILNLDTVTPQEFSQGYVILPIDDPVSMVNWLEPTAGTGSVRTPDWPLPQAAIKFELGLKVIKTLQQGSDIVNIAVDNLDQKPVPQFELIEYPSTVVNPIDIEDNFSFEPLSMLYENRILPWLVSLIPAGVLPPAERRRTQILDRVRNALHQVHTPFLELAPQLDPLLCQISAFASFDETTDKFWQTEGSRGVYKLAVSLPGKASRFLRFRIQDASFALGKNVGLVDCYVDYYTEKYPQRSIYRSRGETEKEISPNPRHSQFVYPTSKPDLWLQTALKESDQKKFAVLFSGGQLPGSWDLLNSPDIEPFWRANGNLGLNIKVHNCGLATAKGAQLRVRTYFLPISGNEYTPPNTISIIPPLMGNKQIHLPDIPARETYATTVQFHQLTVVTSAGGTSTPADQALLQQVKRALAVTVVEIDPTEGEVMLANNSAIEITPIRRTTR